MISHILAKTFFGAKITENRVNFATKRQKVLLSEIKLEFVITANKPKPFLVQKKLKTG